MAGPDIVSLFIISSIKAMRTVVRLGREFVAGDELAGHFGVED